MTLLLSVACLYLALRCRAWRRVAEGEVREGQRRAAQRMRWAMRGRR